MKLPMKIAGLCWSLTFLVTAMPGFYQQTKPVDFEALSAESYSGMNILETLGISLAGSLAAGVIGFVIGEILSKPEGLSKAEREARSRKALKAPEQAQPTPEAAQVTEEVIVTPAPTADEPVVAEAAASAGVDPYP